MRAVIHFIQIIRVGFFIATFFARQRIFNDGFIDPYIAQFFNPNVGGLPQAILHKIKNYYCLGVPITCAVYARIYGKKLSKEELERSVLAGIVTPVIDDFTDEGLLTNEQLNQLAQSPDSFHASSSTEALACNIISRLLNEVPDRLSAAQALQKTIEAQVWSQKQMSETTSKEELAAISLEKGACSHVLFHYLLDQEPTAETITVLHKMGGLLQWSNDIFDVYKDHQSGIRTFANTCPDYRELAKNYLIDCREFCAIARQLPYNKKNLEFFIRFFVLVMARGMVALQQHMRLQDSLGGGQLPLDKLDRKQLICDMERPINLLRTIKYAVRILK